MTNILNFLDFPFNLEQNNEEKAQDIIRTFLLRCEHA